MLDHAITVRDVLYASGGMILGIVVAGGVVFFDFNLEESMMPQHERKAE